MSSDLRLYKLKLVSTFAPLACVAVEARLPSFDGSSTAVTTKIKASIQRLAPPGEDDGSACDPLLVYPRVEG